MSEFVPVYAKVLYNLGRFIPISDLNSAKVSSEEIFSKAKLDSPLSKVG